MKAIISYNWNCEDLQKNVYQKKQWKFKEVKFFDSIKPPYVDLDEGWYIDEDKLICYYYTKNYENKEEIESFIDKLKPIEYSLDCFVKYEYSLITLNNSTCSDPEKNKIKFHNKMFCICKEGTTENCFDEKENVRISSLNSCIKVDENESVYIKQESEAKLI